MEAKILKTLHIPSTYFSKLLKLYIYVHGLCGDMIFFLLDFPSGHFLSVPFFSFVLSLVFYAREFLCTCMYIAVVIDVSNCEYSELF